MKLFNWFYRWAYDYNLFVPDVVTHAEEEDQTVLLKHQKQATWLYVFFLFISLYILFYITVIKPESETITITKITPEIFKEFRLKYPSSFSCPCSTITVPYKTFLNSTSTLHPICSSLFVSEQWIEALYLANSSLYAVSDFRTIANAQFRILARLCSLSKTIIDQIESDLNYNELITKNLLFEEHIQIEINASAEFLKNSLSSRIISFLNYYRTMIHANYFISALNTNAAIQTSSTLVSFIATALRTAYYPRGLSSVKSSSTPVCSIANPISPAGFFSLSYAVTNLYSTTWGYNSSSAQFIKGFSGSCTPLEGLLASTLDCLYDSNCIQILFNYFPALNQFKSNLTNSILPSPQNNLSVYEHFVDLFINEWSIKMNYSTYFQQCAPVYCTYVITNRTSFAVALTLLISLYGGLTIILRIIAPLLISITTKFNNHERCLIVFNIRKYIQQLKQLNLFPKENKHGIIDIRQQLIITRVYLILLPISFLILLLTTSLATETITVEISTPSYDTYRNIHSNTRECPCSNMAIAYKEFIKLVPTFHQICSSSFVSQSWFTILYAISNQKVSIDWFNQIPSQFQLLSNLCQLANRTIDDGIHRLMKQSFITSNLLTESEITAQMNIIFDEFFQSTILHFGLVVDILHLLTQIDQLFMGITGNSLTTFQTNIYGNLVTNLTSGQRSVQFKFFLTGTQNVNTTLVQCICAINPYCQSSVAIYDVTYKTTSTYDFNVSYIVPGFIRGCSTMNSVLYSTLECFYQDSDCFAIVINYIKTIYFQAVESPLWFDIKPLFYDPILTSYLPNTTIDKIIKQLMIENWNPSISYQDYYQTCAPMYCTYKKSARSRTIINVVTIFVSMLGGLTVSLRLLVPIIVKCTYFMMKKIRKSPGEQTRNRRINRLNAILKQLMTKLIDLNIFHLNDFQSNTDRMTVKQLGRWSTRLFICLYTIGIVTLAIYTVIHPRIVTKTFLKPSFNSYLQLKQKYTNRLECSCSSIASNYDKFIRIKPIFHSICLSSIVTDEWRANLTGQLAANLSIYNERDYRRFLSAHLQLLTGLCQLSIRSINDTINEFLSSVFITNQLLSENDFHLRLNLSIVQTISNAPIILTRLFYFVQDINHGNAFMSNYGTNFRHIIPIYESGRVFAQTEGCIYDDQCACDRYFNCTSQAYFMSNDTSTMVKIKGLKIGCTPSESFRSSTLECFFDTSCLQLIQNYTQSTYISIPSLTIPTRFSIDTTIVELFNELFVDDWSININYSSYFQYCSPQFCSYTYVQQLNILYIVTLILSLQGGLIIVLKWICPKFVQFTYKINEYRTNKRNLVQPTYAINMTPFSSDSSTNSDNSTTSDIELIPINTIQYSVKMITSCVLCLSVITVGLIIFSIYFVRQEKNEPIVTMSSKISLSTTYVDTFTTSMTDLSSTTTTAMHCQIKFQSMVAYRSPSMVSGYSPIIADFNNDKRLDIASLQVVHGKIIILFQDTNQTFSSSLVISVGCTGFLTSLATSDFNNDSLLDFVGTCGSFNYIFILLANKNGTFERPLIYPTGNDSNPIDVIIADFNNDHNWDIAVAQSISKRIGIYFGYGNGTFSNPTILSTGRNSFPRTIALADFNNDSYEDIAVVNYQNRNIGIFLSYNNGSFDEQKTFFTGGGALPYNFALGDFNKDNIPDVVCSYHSKSSISILFGRGNGNLSESQKILVQFNLTLLTPSITVADINHDDYPDILIGIGIPYTIYALIADGNGYFQQQIVFSSASTAYQLDITTGDINDDGYPDIIATAYQGYTIDVFLNTGQCLFPINP